MLVGVKYLSLVLSLPLWECGLKCYKSGGGNGGSRSLPLWECGLKFLPFLLPPMLFLSLPLWECGLKYCFFLLDYFMSWSLPLWECGLKSVTPALNFPIRPSLPLWECGLKSPLYHTWNYLWQVTPLVGVWIEICIVIACICLVVCHSPCGSVDWNKKI